MGVCRATGGMRVSYYWIGVPMRENAVNQSQIQCTENSVNLFNGYILNKYWFDEPLSDYCYIRIQDAL